MVEVYEEEAELVKPVITKIVKVKQLSFWIATSKTVQVCYVIVKSRKNPID